VPSAAPSKYPTTTMPTKNGDTNPPTSHPTAAPTYDRDYFSHFTYGNYLTTKSGYLAVPNSFTFATYYYKGSTINGLCNDWRAYAGKQLQLPFDDVQFSTLVAEFNIYDFNSRQTRTEKATCSSVSVVNGIIASLKYGTEFEGNCADRTWRVFSCNGRTVFCVNCKKNCVKTVSCPGTSFIVNPCTSCLTYTASSAFVNVRYGYITYYPQFQLPVKVLHPFIRFRLFLFIKNKIIMVTV
jgi:hypothetical protein